MLRKKYKKNVFNWKFVLDGSHLRGRFGNIIYFSVSERLSARADETFWKAKFPAFLLQGFFVYEKKKTNFASWLEYKIHLNGKKVVGLHFFILYK